jgi:hypothetical protein
MPTFTKSIAEQKQPPPQRRRTGVGVLVAFISLISLIIVGGLYYLISDGGEEPTPAATLVKVTATPVTWLTLDGYESDGTLAVTRINLWKDYENRAAGIAGVGLHGERVKLIRRLGDGVKVELPDGTQGWVTYYFVKEYK